MSDTGSLVNQAPSIEDQTLEELKEELSDARLLHRLSTELIQEDGTAGLYKKIVEGAVAIMRSQYASMQMLYPQTSDTEKLKLLASSGFSPEEEKFWEWVNQDTGSSCGAALKARQRVIIPNFATSEFMVDKPTLPIFLESGIYAAQSTPLYSRSGKLLGMISTHWSTPHTPPSRHLYLLDMLARQAADLIERSQNAYALKESEEQLRMLATHLEEMVGERTRELKRSNEDLFQFAHVASHDLKEPVRKIITFAIRLQEELQEWGNEISKTYIEKILESSNRMSTMIDGVLKYSSLNAVADKLEMIDLNSVLGDIRNDLELVVHQKRALIHYEELSTIKGVKVLVYQLFYNLVNNSLKFSKENQSPVIKITSRQEVTNDCAYHVIEVSDNGIGFSPEHCTEIFQAFTRLNTKRKYEGTGLGLSLVKKIVERHKGIIHARGKLNEGAVFTILWPVEGPD